MACVASNFFLYILLFLADFQIFDGHNGNAAAIYTRENLLNHVLAALPRGLGRDEWLHALPRALVAGFVKTDKEFQHRGSYASFFSKKIKKIFRGNINLWMLHYGVLNDLICTL